MSQVERNESRLYRSLAKSNPQTPSSAQPAIFARPNQGSSFNVTTAAANDVSSSDEIARQTSRILRSNAGHSFFDQPVVADILRHDRWNSVVNVVRSMELTAEWASLNVTAALGAHLA
jgi:hypothetical protein